MTIPSLRTGRLLLRAIQPEDLDQYHARLFADPEVMRYLPGGAPIPRGNLDGVVERSHGHWEQHGYGVWIVCLASTGELLGQCGLRFVDELKETELLYALARPWWGQGVATEAGRASLAFGFQDRGLQRVIALAVPENVASRKVMEHLGMTLEGEDDVFGLHCVRYAVTPEGFDPGDHPFEISS